MSGRCLQCQLCCAVSRILCYQFCCCCMHEKTDPKQEIDILMLGHQNVGKTHLLATLCNEATDEIESTNGFSMKDIVLEKTILHVKELGGSPKIIPYWEHYFSTKQSGIIYIIDGKTLEKKQKCDENCDTLKKILSNHNLQNIPLIVFVSKLESNTTESLEEITAILELKDICNEPKRDFLVEFAFDTDHTRVALERFVSLIVGTGEDE
ncbi:ADP-ribosylation factor-like protein 3 [Clytia hemisphaerica]|uniref:ADP-ribosylation factor-like protein 3 n=1 Tax=Clytia hemisphaerica TaxID=252671 RepID=UPI0034D7B6A3